MGPAAVDNPGRPGGAEGPEAGFYLGDHPPGGHPGGDEPPGLLGGEVGDGGPLPIRDARDIGEEDEPPGALVVSPGQLNLSYLP